MCLYACKSACTCMLTEPLGPWSCLQAALASNPLLRLRRPRDAKDKYAFWETQPVPQFAAEEPEQVGRRILPPRHQQLMGHACCTLLSQAILASGVLAFGCPPGWGFVMHTHAHALTNACARVHMHMHTHVNTHTYTHAHILTHILTHMYSRTRNTQRTQHTCMHTWGE